MMPGLSNFLVLALLGPAALVMTLGGAARAGGQPLGPPESSETGEPSQEPVSVRILADVPQVRPGREFHLAIAFRIREQWHIYWKNPGDSGLATLVQVTAPPGYRVGKVRFPRPRRFSDGRSVTYGYEKETVLFVPITPPKGEAYGSATFDCQIDWLACRGACRLGSARQSITLPVGERPPVGATGAVDPVIAKYKGRLPRPLKDLKEAGASFDGDRLTVTGPRPETGRVTFFPVDRPGVSFGEADIAIEKDRFVMAVPVTIDAANAMGEPMIVEGLVMLGPRDDDPCYRVALSAETEATRGDAGRSPSRGEVSDPATSEGV